MTAAELGVQPGDTVRLQHFKWPDRMHYGADCVYLGADEHGDWLGDPVGNDWWGGPAAKPSITSNVILMPPTRAFSAMFYGPHVDYTYRVYVDITTPAEWLAADEGRPPMVTQIDLDLDVIDPLDAPPFIDDEDEFAQHQKEFGYPAKIVAMAERECAAVAAEVGAGDAWSLQATAQRWFDRLAELRPEGAIRRS